MPITRDPTEYSAASIVVPEGLDTIRFRPSLYLAGSPSERLVLAVVGGMCLSIEAVALGRANVIELTIGSGLAFTVADGGSFPDLRQRYASTERTLGETLLSILMACRDIKPPELAHLCEIAIVIPNALSRQTTLSVSDEGVWWSMEFRDGKLVSPFARGEAADAGGVRLAFDLDPVFFPDARFDDDVVTAIRARVQATIPCAGIVIHRVHGERTE